MPQILLLTFIGYGTGAIGFVAGALFSGLADKFSKRLHGALMGFTAGLLIAFVCFEMLPVSFENWGLYRGTIALGAGVACAMLLEGKIIAGQGRRYSGNKHIATGIFIGAGLAIHNIPEGMAIGAMLNCSLYSGLSMAAIVAVHCFPEALAVMEPLRQGGLSVQKLLVVALLMGVPMAAGTAIGVGFSAMLPQFVYVCLAFASGVMMYIACGEILPDAKEIWKGRTAGLAAVLGFALGIFITA